MTVVTDCTKDIEVISKMYLVQFINPVKSLVAIHVDISQKFGFACNDGNVPGVRPGGREDGQANVLIGVNQPTGSPQSSY